MGRGATPENGIAANVFILRNRTLAEYNIPVLERLPSKYPVFTVTLSQDVMEKVRMASDACAWCGEPLSWDHDKSPALPLSKLLPKPYDGNGLVSTCKRCAHKYSGRSLQSVIDGLQTILYNKKAIVEAWLHIERIHLETSSFGAPHYGHLLNQQKSALENVPFDTGYAEDYHRRLLDLNEKCVGLVGLSWKKRSIKRLVFMFGPTCVWCGVNFSENALTLEHLIPQSDLPCDNLDNLVLACKSCNNKRGNISLAEYASQCDKNKLRIDVMLAQLQHLQNIKHEIGTLSRLELNALANLSSPPFE